MAVQCPIRAKQVDKTGPEWNFTGGDPTIGGVDIATVDDINPFVTWVDPSLVIQMLGDRTIAEIDALTPTEGQTVVAASPGTPLAPGSDLLAIGDIAYFNGTGWFIVKANVAGAVEAGTMVVVANDGTTIFSPFTAGQNGARAEADGVGGWTITAPTEGDATLIYGDGYNYENQIWAWTTTGLPSTVVQIAGGVSVTQVNGTFGILASPTTGVVTLSAVADSAPAGAANGSGVLQGTISVLEEFTPSVATVTGDVVGPALVGTPVDTYGHLILNGLPYNYGDGDKLSDYYWSIDGGTTAQLLSAVGPGSIAYLALGPPTDGSDCAGYSFRALST
jgi:hypothetical protein